MEGLVKLIGIIILAGGIVYFIKPNLMKQMVDFFTKDNWIYFGGILSFIIGIILLRAASTCAISWFVFLMGLAALIKGIVVFVLGRQKIRSLMGKLTKMPVKTLRIIALINIALGVMLVYAA